MSNLLIAVAGGKVDDIPQLHVHEHGPNPHHSGDTRMVNGSIQVLVLPSISHMFDPRCFAGSIHKFTLC